MSQTAEQIIKALDEAGYMIVKKGTNLDQEAVFRALEADQQAHEEEEMRKIDRERVLPILAEIEERIKVLRKIVASNLEEFIDLDFAKHLVVLGTATVALQKNILKR